MKIKFIEGNTNNEPTISVKLDEEVFVSPIEYSEFYAELQELLQKYEQ